MDLVDVAVAAHGGLDRWKTYTSVSAHLKVGGVLWSLKQQGGPLDDTRVRVALHREYASHYPFGDADLHTVFTPERVAVENDANEVVEERLRPRAAFEGHTLTTPWDRLHLAYFAGYAMWTYFTAPFSFTMPGFRTEELSPWQEDGQTWRRLSVEFPDSIATHGKRQTFYFDREGLVRRHDYTSEVLGAGPAAHYSSGHREFGGIVVPTQRRVHLIGEDGGVMPDPLVVSIDIDDVVFE
ncbi:hypothetical protein GCM10011583_61220 [Streptomyces camponoticapitis]|uniref:Uncharacterized protein n=1 Tax=Streptomyces camponoticapitis TaxID=1616125 RepID=A0ABQ2EQN2_9ACTN|nr:hypothetical protein [Streptomyces camponoticapitis]GGK21049.1 hypothetical protein GCM10011583_61220 [Streptomyces camponoticapitis]